MVVMSFGWGGVWGFDGGGRQVGRRMALVAVVDGLAGGKKVRWWLSSCRG
ncbi:pollen-specific leucine-rich repeat extensin-like protein 3 [Iris pallida]|uniref:Pollen-specific leucine-rich repeat extensin-like protein 3 n=1 Tax=Iris pallida TaxID=29817 RepID=A0AAX6E1D8_IRIPA|nr:pollen-specific leucine-rich repeat extensin-like protein 3 [Iris pallida]KAJ6812381.1 pollen-specific leucine-rich repeat extensin-like protein 3 [Iris pallida]